jgi:hypothetical protein
MSSNMKLKTRIGKTVVLPLTLLATILLPAAFGSQESSVFNNSLPEVDAFLVAGSVLVGLGMFRKQRRPD